MGGNALKNHETRRYAKDEYLSLERRIFLDFKDLFDTYPLQIPYFSFKDSFGDMDLIITANELPPNWKQILIDFYDLDESMYTSNGGVFSFAVENFQIDLITAENYLAAEMAVSYFAFNDLGNLIGRIFHKLGMKYGHKGLSLVVRPDDNSHVMNEILLTQDMQIILSILGLSYEKYQSGFEDLEDIFRYVASSRFFDPDIYLFHNRNHKAVIRDKKRSTYNGFLEWIRHKNPPTHFNFEEKSEHGGYNIREPFYSEIVVPNFPWVESQVERLIYHYKQVQKAKEKINGLFIREITGLEGKELGEFIQWADLNPSTWVIEDVELFNRIVTRYPDFPEKYIGIYLEDWGKSDD
jgi:hypothetical protein